MNVKRTLFGLVLLALLLSACASPAALVVANQSEVISQPAAPTVLPVIEQHAAEQPDLKEIGIQDLSVEIGFGSPLPVNAVISSTWLGLCSQLAQIDVKDSSSGFDIQLLASPDQPGCPPDQVGLPFTLKIPLNMAEKPFGIYNISANGMETTFAWNGALSSQTPELTRFAWEGVSFLLDPSVASSAMGERAPENADTNSPYWEIKPEYLHFSLRDYPLSQTTQQPVIGVYPVADYRRLSDLAGANLDALADLLAGKPAAGSQMPFLPLTKAGQVFHSNVKTLYFQNGSGVRYLTVLAQYPAPVNNQDLFYTFQGLTADGRYLVSIIMPVNHPSLPADMNSLSIGELEGIARDPGYYPKMTEALSALPDDSFMPNLAKLDALVASLVIDR